MCMLCTSFQAEGVTGARALAVTSAMPENSLRKPSGRTTSILQRLATNGALRMCSNSYAHTEVAQALSNDEFVQYIRASPHALFDSRCEADSATNLSRLSRFFTKKTLRNGGLAHEPTQAADSHAACRNMALTAQFRPPTAKPCTLLRS